MRKNDLNQSSLLSYLGKFSSMSYSGLSRVSMYPRNKSEDDCSEYMSKDDKRECVLEDDFTLKSSLRADFPLSSSLRGDRRGQAIYELEKRANRKIPGIFLQGRKIGMTMMMWILVSSLTMTGTVYAECTPAPDCVSIGYTETSCEGKFVRCPFDISKLFCLPCDSSYKYACSETGEIGSGTACNGKYIECECTDGYELVDGACVVSCAYTLTALPTGCSAADSCVKNGTTYYSSTCTSCKNGYTLSSGSCTANTCSGYYTSKTGCSSYTTCKSGTTTKYKCTACNNGYTLNSGQCKANTCDGYNHSTVPYACTSYTTCTKASGSIWYKCSACSSGYTLNIIVNQCIDDYCYDLDSNRVGVGTVQSMNGASGCSGTICTGNDGLEYCMGFLDL